MKRLSFALAGVLAFPLAASAAVYPGNGNSGFGGPVGLGSLSLSDDGTTLNGTFTKGTNGVNENPVGTSTSPTYTFSLPLSSIGITPGNKSFTMLGTYISNSGFRSDEFIAGNGTGTQGWNPFVGTTAAQYTSTVTPEPASF